MTTPTPAERAAWRQFFAVLNRLPSTLDSHVQKHTGMTHFEYQILEILSEQPDCRMQLAELADYSAASLSRLSHVVTALGKRRLVVRQLVAGQRGTDAVLTDAGLVKVAESHEIYRDAVYRTVFRGLHPTDVGHLERLMAEVTTQIAAFTSPITTGSAVQ